uniref:Uncharacterized mitochondrial protein AtMg00810-like n=1 Tax=Nicotiana tabacum TaxID=4097 RepID=A0A1S3XEA1_TOBAC|nr:PREDICTED: uncharacterized mitochondrial protein AtMg00810-like [Nicotiana tabacum]
MKDLGRLEYFFGIEVARNPDDIFLCQRKYILDIISEAGLLAAKPTNTPLEQNHKLVLATGDDIEDPSQFMQHPKKEHLDAVMRVVRYLKRTPGQGILLRANCDLRLYAYCDSDWAGCPLTRRSLSGYFVLLRNSPISWKTKKQHTMSRSSAEAEYCSMTTTAWLKGLLASVGVSHSDPLYVCIVTTSQLCTLLLIPFIMKERSTLKWIVISFAMRFKMEIFRLSL